MDLKNETEKPPVLNFDSIYLKEEDLHSIRMSIYHSKGIGYALFKNFISPEFVSHIRAIWPENEKPLTYEKISEEVWAYKNAPNYHSQYEDGTYVYYNFLHNSVFDEVTHEVVVAVHMLRNRLSGRNAFADLTGDTGLCYRVTNNKNYEKWIKPHRDWLDWDRRWEKGHYDPSRLQATLFLSEYGVDYEEGGFKYTKNDGTEILFGRDVEIKPGDLVIWRYGNLHSVENVKTSSNKFGYMRILFPIYDLGKEPVRPRKRLKTIIDQTLKYIPHPIKVVLRKLKGFYNAS